MPHWLDNVGWIAIQETIGKIQRDFQPTFSGKHRRTAAV
jgi:hypothetical protein